MGEAVIYFTSSLFVSDIQSRKVKPEKAERGHGEWSWLCDGSVRLSHISYFHCSQTFKSEGGRRKQEGWKLMQTNLAKATLLPCLSGLGFTHKDLPSPGEVRASLPRTSFLVPWVGSSSDPSSFSGLHTMDEGLVMIPRCCPVPLGRTEVWVACKGNLGTGKSCIQHLL